MRNIAVYRGTIAVMIDTEAVCMVIFLLMNVFVVVVVIQVAPIRLLQLAVMMFAIDNVTRYKVVESPRDKLNPDDTS